MVDRDTLHQCSKDWLERSGAQYGYFYNNNFDDENTDFILTYLQYLLARGLMRHRSDLENVYVYSKVGREIIEDENKRTALIGEFWRFYTGSTD